MMFYGFRLRLQWHFTRVYAHVALGTWIMLTRRYTVILSLVLIRISRMCTTFAVLHIARLNQEHRWIWPATTRPGYTTRWIVLLHPR